jgi:transposase
MRWHATACSSRATQILCTVGLPTIKTKDFLACSAISRVVHVGGVFEQRDELLDRLRQGPAQEAQAEVASTADVPTPSTWTLRTIRASIPALQDYSLSGVWRVLQRCKLGLRTAQVRRFSPDPDYRTKEDTLLQCLMDAALRPRHCVLLFLSEMGYTRWPEPAQDWAPVAPDPVPEVTTSGTNTQWRIIGALNAVTGQVDYRDDYIVGRRQVIAMYQRIEQVYSWAESIYVVQDNWSIHRHEDVQVALYSRPQIVPVWLPTYAPWLNPIEKLWRWLRQVVLKLHRSAEDWPALRQQVRFFLDQFSAGSHALLHYVGLCGDGKLAQALRPS